jgi:hypothetical protein
LNLQLQRQRFVGVFKSEQKFFFLKTDHAIICAVNIFDAGVVTRDRRIGYWGRCYDHNFLRFSTIFGEKNDVFLKNQYLIIFSKFSFVLSQKRQFFPKIFGENILKIITSVPGLLPKILKNCQKLTIA